MGKDYATYVKDRLSGFAGHYPRPPHLDLAPYPEFREAMARMIAQQLVQFAHIVGRERVLAGTDCGFGSFAGLSRVDPGIVYKKLGALVEGAARASARLWHAPRGSG
jgi:hypothetical protein